MSRQFISDGYFSGINEDTYTYVSWAWQFADSLREGIFYPRWISHNFWGYGAPIFILYPPLAFYLTAFFAAFSDSFVLAMNVTKFTALFLSGLGFFFLVKKLYSYRAAFFSAVIYILLPYTVMQYYYFGNFASVISFFWFPYIILFLHRYFYDKRCSNIVLAGLCYGGLISTHLINAYMFAFIIIIFVIHVAWVNNDKIAILVIPIVLSIGILVSAAYILPVLMEKHLLQLPEFIKEGSGLQYNFHYLLSKPSGRDPFWSAYSELIVLHVIILCIITVILSFINLALTFKYRIKDDKFFVLFLVLFVLSIAVTLESSSILWNNIPYFKYIQFPTRWINISIFLVPLLLGSVVHRIGNDINILRTKYTVIGLLYLICLIIDLKIIITAHQFPSKTLFPIRTINMTTEHMPAGVISDNIALNLNKHTGNVEIKGNGNAQELKWKSAERVIDLRADGPISVRIRTFNFPGWEAYLDNLPTGIRTETRSGAIVLDVPNGRHTLKLIFKDTSPRLAGKTITAISIALSLLVITLDKIRSKIAQRVRQPPLITGELS